jgi:hypothetical protein
MQVTIMLAVLGDGSKLTPNMILNCKTKPKEEVALRNHCQISLRNWFAVAWTRMSGILLQKQGALVLDVCRYHLAQEINATNSPVNMNLVVILTMMTSKLQC